MQKIISIIICFFIGYSLNAQITASEERGCIPLAVQFNGPNMATYFWDFGDGGGNSDETSPTRTFTEPGTYTVELFDTSGGTSAGTINITVYADPEIMFSVQDDETLGCAPFFVQFTNESIVDPAVPVTGYLWAFGDGATSNQENPSHIYNGEGTYPVTLQIFSSLAECGNIMTFEDFITVSGTVAAGFTLNTLEICEAPATFEITNNTPNDPAYTYEWDFGDGSSIVTDRDPGSHTYTSPGTYTITLIVDNGDGCKVTRQRNVRVGGPEIVLNIPDTLCINSVYRFLNQTQASVFSWTIGGGGFPATSFERQPEVQFFDTGDKLITLSVTSPTGCVSDTTFSVYVQEIDPSFTVDPLATCSDPATFVFTPNVTNYESYIWQPIPDTGSPEGVASGNPNGLTYTVEYMDNPNWDSFHINRPDTLFYSLTAISNAGCVGVGIGFSVFRDIEAHPVPNQTRGCAPLTVEFDNRSQSIEPIIRNDWDFGDGTTLSDPTGSDQSHTFTSPGEYYVKLIVENDNGCIDTSTGIWIYVGEPISSDFTIDKTEICLFDTVSFEALNLDPRIDAWHFETDDGRNGHCYKGTTTEHAFVTSPGSYPVTLELEYNGCFNKEEVGTIEVNGAKALIQYMTNCDDPYTVMLRDSSFGASSVLWTIEDQTFTDSVFNYTFSDTGIYTIYLEAFDATSSCPSNIDSAEIHIVDIMASFAVDSINCEGPILFDATSSVGVDDRCHKGYTWYFPTNRPRRIGLPTITQGMIQGPDPDREWNIRLEVEDINGCTDDTIIAIKVYDIDADFEFARDKICFPSEMTVTDQSVSDTTIVSWMWSTTGANDSIVTFLAEGDAMDTLPYEVQLIVEDELGCVDTIARSIETYEIFSVPTVLPNPVCIGDTVNLSATDYTQDGSFLNFDWTITGDNGFNRTSQQQSYSLPFDNRGTYNFNLKIKEDASGCENEYDGIINVVDIPVADISFLPAPPEPVCIGDFVEFVNNSTIDGAGGYIWDFGNGAPLSVEETPTIAYPERGTFDIEMIAQSSAGCADTAYTQITTVGPRGDFMIDNNMLCQEGMVTFTLVNPDGVESFTWDFGDGTTADDVNPITHTYDLVGTTSQTINAQLILRGDDMTCEIIKDIQIQITDLGADFTTQIDSTFCPHRVILSSGELGEGLNESIQLIDNSTSEIIENYTSFPEILMFENEGNYKVVRTVSLANGDCDDTYELSFDIGTNVLNADFTYVIDSTSCPHKVIITSQPLGADEDESITVLESSTMSQAGIYDPSNGIITFDNIGSYKIVRNLSNSVTGCSGSNETDIEIGTNEIEALFIAEVDTTLCPPIINVTNQSNPFDFDMISYDQEGEIDNSGNISIVANLPNQDNEISIEQTISNSLTGCQASFTQNVVVSRPIIINSFKANPIDGECVGKYMLENVTTNSGAIVTYSTNLNPSIDSDDQTITLSGGDSIIIQTVSIGSADYCMSSEIVSIDPIEIQVPNIFTPNGDMHNDTFNVVRINEMNNGNIECITICSFQVYDRWGNEVFSTDNNSGWDGTIDGSPAPTDMYVYIIKAYYADPTTDEYIFDCSDANANLMVFKGNVLLAY